MKMRIAHRLFLSILVATSLAILCMFLIMEWSINRGFIGYVNTGYQGRLEELTARLEEAYAEHGSWEFLGKNPRRWIMRMTSESPDDVISQRPGRYDRRLDALPSSPREGVPGRRLPFVLLDEDRRPLFGDPKETEEANFRPILSDGQTVGFVGLLPPRHFLTPPQLAFLKQQRFALVLAAFGIVLVLAIFSLPLANRLVRPVRAMAAATHDFASGKYSVRVRVSSSDELGQLAADFNAMALTLEKNENARRQWVADVSHELRTPLSVLRGEIEALMEGIRTVTPESIRSLHAEVLRLHRLVDDLYQLSLSDLGTLTYHKEDLDLAEIIREAVESYRTEFSRSGLSLTLDIGRGPVYTVFADKERLYQLFGNLLENSMKYTDAGGKLTIHLSCSKGQAVIDIDDTAPGVPESELDKLFDRLYRVEGSRSRATGGAGLGLAICRNIVEAHAGTIDAHPSQLGGVKIKITIPVSGSCP